MTNPDTAKAARNLRAARLRLHDATEAAKAAAHAEDAAGTSEVKIAELLGVNRLTIRSWLGK